MNINLYTNYSDKKVLKKQVSLISSVGNVNLIEPTSLLHPTLELYLDDRSIISKCNYIYIDDFGRYYYIADNGIEFLLGGMIRLRVDIDPLMSWSNEISRLYCYIQRNEFKYSPYVNDDMLPTRCNRIKESKVIGNLQVDTSTHCVVLTTSAV